MNIKVNYHSSILINNEIYVDPLKVDGKTNAKYIFITHPHWDHFSMDDISKIITNETKIICPKSMKNDIKNLISDQIIYVEPQQTYNVDDIEFKTFHSYNIDKKFHPKENLWVGYLITIKNETIAIVGDSDSTPELRELKTDILLLPVGGHFTMNVEEAVELTNLIKPKMVIPTHYGEVVGDKNMGYKFKSLIDKDIICELQIWYIKK